LDGPVAIDEVLAALRSLDEPPRRRAVH
jgi:hypothetical protein